MLELLSRLGANKRGNRYDVLGKCQHVGPGARVVGLPHVVNKGRITIGSSFSISAIPARSHLVTEPGGAIEIGDEVEVGAGSGIASSLGIRVGSRTRIGSFVLIMDSDYHVAGDADAIAPTSPVEIGSNVCIGHNVIILRGTTIPNDTTVAPGSVIQGRVSPGSSVAPAPTQKSFLTNLMRDVSGGTEGSRAQMGDAQAMTSLQLTLEDTFGVHGDSSLCREARSALELATLIVRLSHFT